MTGALREATTTSDATMLPQGQESVDATASWILA